MKIGEARLVVRYMCVSPEKAHGEREEGPISLVVEGIEPLFGESSLDAGSIVGGEGKEVFPSSLAEKSLSSRQQGGGVERARA